MPANGRWDLILRLKVKLAQKVFPLESAHYARVVQELYVLNVLMMVKPSFMLLCKPVNFTRHNIHLQASVEVIVPNVPGCIDRVP